MSLIGRNKKSEILNSNFTENRAIFTGVFIFSEVFNKAKSTLSSSISNSIMTAEIQEAYSDNNLNIKKMPRKTFRASLKSRTSQCF